MADPRQLSLLAAVSSQTSFVSSWKGIGAKEIPIVKNVGCLRGSRALFQTLRYPVDRPIRYEEGSRRTWGSGEW